jgi:nucleoside-diphosphate-sugar epimerase
LEEVKLVSKVLITGGAGFIGHHLTRRLLRMSYEVVVLDNFKTGKMQNISPHLKNAPFKLVVGDVRNKKVIRNAMNGVDAVVHLAALISVEESFKNPIETHNVNVTGTLNVLEEAARMNIEKFIYASSTAVYGDGNPLPLREGYPPKPLSPYATSKVSAEYYCEMFHRSYRLKTVILRYFNVYGPGQENNPYSGVIAKFLSNALSGAPIVIHGDGKQTRDFIYIDDVVEATILALESSDAVGQTFNICTGTPVSINELATIVKELMRKDLKITYDKPRKGDIRDNYGDPSKAFEILKFKAKNNLKEGIKKYISFYLPTSSS